MSRIWTPGGDEGSGGPLWVPGENAPKRDEQQSVDPPESREGRDAPAANQEMPLPPATFEFLLLSLRSQAEMHLGLLSWAEAPGEESRIPVDLPLARHLIDLLGMLQEKTRGNLALEEQRLLENTLTELRFRYVQRADEAGRNR
jgi:hypothetical protein